MAVTGKEVDALATGLDLKTPNSGSFALNTYVEEGALAVRGGFGLIWQSEPSARNPTAGAWGARQLLGCHAIETDFGAKQVLSAYNAEVMNSNVDRATSGESRGRRVVISVYDVTTNTWMDEILMTRTSEYGTQRTSILEAMAAGTTNSGVDRSSPFFSEDSPVWFVEYQNAVIFGSTSIGVWAYFPALFQANRDKVLDRVHTSDDAQVYGESAAVVKIAPVDGLFAADYEYITTDLWPSPSAAAVVVNRVCYAEGTRVFFSDIGKPGSVIPGNILQIPCDGEITALGEAAGSLIICTKTQTWLFRPTLGTYASTGDLRVVSRSVGCVGPNAMTRIDNLLAWIDRNGIYANGGDLSLQELTASCRRMFTDDVSSPIPHYDDASGVTGGTTPQPRTYTRISEADGRHFKLCFAPKRRLLMASFPGLKRALVGTAGSWALWTFDSEMTTTGNSVVGSDKLGGFQLLPLADDLFAWSSPEVLTPDDQVGDENNAESSMRLYKWQRGGGVDGTSRYLDDKRELAQYYTKHVSSGTTGTYRGALIIGKPMLLPSGSKMPRSGTLSRDTWLWPIGLLPARSSEFVNRNVRRLAFRLQFNNTYWKPTPFGTEIDFDLPAERIASGAGWGPGAVVPGAREVQTYLAGVADADGNEMRLYWDGGVGGFANSPNMPLMRNRFNPLMLLPIARIGSGDAMSLGLTVNVAQQYDGTSWYDLDVWEFEQGTRDQPSDDVNQQAIDWALKSGQLALDEGETVQLRTVYSRIQSHNGVADIQANAIGEFNVAYGADGREWSGQVIDYTNGANATIAPGLNVRKRVQKSGVMEQKLFNNGLTWADVLVDDEQHDMIATSGRSKGEFVSVMMFGHLQSRSSSMVVASCKVRMDLAGQRRRIGR